MAHIACFIKFVSVDPHRIMRVAFYFTNSIHLLSLSVNRSFGFGDFCHLLKITRRCCGCFPIRSRPFRKKYDPSTPKIAAVSFPFFAHGSPY
jgi:hypothetical protein